MPTPKILVTGGTGDIGSHTAVELLQEGMEVVIIDNLSNSERKVLDGIAAITGKKPHFEQVDLRDREATFRVFEKHPDMGAINHFAPIKAGGDREQKQLAYYELTLRAVIHLREAMTREAGDHRVVSSSSTV